MTKNIYYSFNDLLSKNCLLNFVIGMRGGGKSFGAKKKAIKDFKKDGSQFVYVRRYKTELKKLPQFFKDMQEHFPDDKLEVKGKTFYINGREAGYAVALSTAGQEKSTPYPFVRLIIFDEFLISSKGHQRYLPNEVEAFLELVESIIRLRDNVRVVLLGNNFSLINPYFTHWKIQLDQRKKINTWGDYIAVETYTNEAFKHEKVKTRFGRLIDGTEYGKYSIDNESLEDNEVLIAKMPARRQFNFNLVYMGRTFGVWSDYKDGRMFLSEQYEKEAYATYSVTTTDHRPNILFAHKNKYARGLVLMRKAWSTGNLYFDTQAVKKAGIEILRIIY